MGKRYLYRRMRRWNLSLQELNRARIGPILEDTRDVLSLECSGPASSPPNLGFTVNNGNVPYRHWLTASEHISDIPPADGICRNQSVCYSLREQVMHLLSSVTAMCATVVRPEETTCLTGLSVTPAGHGSIRVGYQGSWGEESLDLTGSRGGYVKGFNLAVGEYGIQALQCIFFYEDTSRWVGNPREAPASRLSAPDGLVHGLKAEFNVRKLTHATNLPVAKTCLLTFCCNQEYKMVALSISTMQSDHGTERMPI